MYSTITSEIVDRVMIVTLNRPERMNAFNEKMCEEMIHAFNEADENDDVRAVILTGAGDDFCAGMDLEKGAETFMDHTPLVEYRDAGGMLSLRIFEMKKPMIAAINGAAVGIGITMTLPMDIRIASTDAKMGFVFARRGITMEACSGWFLPRLVGMGKASEWIFTGRMISASEAYEGRLVNKIVEPNELMSAAMEIATDIAENTSSVSVTLSRQLMWTMLGANHPVESHKIESKMIHWTGKQADALEGIEAFLEKRKADFKMKSSTDMPPFYPWGTDRTYEVDKK
ncbi:MULTISPECIES: crotonase/enoyl-CoA hydratase family protein [Peribacillus]|uniref:crotonase/enoyl-CoA hydratase family protein n=1 Tax=Peribacillus TaxID=2675229 RepID=UPI0020401248|nr:MULTISPECIES: crotonase/enoyl-CoA hydratase family protein [Peribacillus]MCM3677051.1 crotonase/enoyl-CoA hydratase family protein [Peribacillus simplex]MDQ0883928.1 enoyl-CoA hydratase/carnithine racemase [Peribacillus sp. V2I11]